MMLIRSGMMVLLDDDDFHKLESDKWYVTVNLYTKRAVIKKYIGRYETKKNRPKYRQMYLSRFILSAPYGFVVDHINGNTLDNRKSNLRACTQSQNLKNRVRSKRNGGGTSKYKGVYKTKNKTNPWNVDIRILGKLVYRGSFKSELEAAMAYDAMAIKHHGEFAKLNFGNNK